MSHNPESQQIKETIRSIDPQQASNVEMLMDAVNEDLLKRPEGPDVISAKTILGEAADNMLRSRTKESLEDFKSRLYDISSSFNMVSDTGIVGEQSSETEEKDPVAKKIREVLQKVDSRSIENIMTLMGVVKNDLLNTDSKKASGCIGQLKMVTSSLLKNQNKKGLEEFRMVLYDIHDSIGMPEGVADKAYFTLVCNSIDLSMENIGIYYQAYLDLAPDKRVSLTEIDVKIGMFQEKYGRAVTPEILQRATIEAFGKLINGQTEGLANNDVLEQYADFLTSEMQAKQEEIADKKKEVAILERLKERNLKSIGEWVEANPSNWKIFTPSTEPHIKSAIGNLENTTREIAEGTAKLKRLEEELRTLNGELFLSQYEFTLNKGEDTTNVLLAAADTLGDDVPSALKAKIEEAKRAHVADPECSPFDKLFYQGKYAEALEVLAKQNEERNDVKIPSTFGRVGEHDILAIYEKYKEGEDPNAQYLYKGFNKDSFAAQKIKEGYKAIILKTAEERPWFRDTAFLVKEYPDGRIGYMMIALSGRAMETFPDSHDRSMRELAEKDAQEYFITPEKQDQIHAKNPELQQNAAKALAASPNIKKLKDASEILQTQFGPLQTLLQSAGKGKKTQDFVDKAKEYAREVKRSNAEGALSTLRRDIAGARADLAALRKVAGYGMVDEFEANLQKLEKSFSAIADAVDDEKINTFLTFIISDNFEADTCWRWIYKTGLPFLAAIAAAVGAIALAYFSFGTLSGLSGMIIVSAFGAVGGIVGNELGTAGGELIGKWHYGDSFTSETMLMKAFSGERYYDEKTKTYKDVDLETLAKTYGKQFIYGVASTFIFLGLGQLCGRALATVAANNVTSGGVAGWAAKVAQKLPGIGAKEANLITQGGFKETFKRLSTMYFTEIIQETAENVAGSAHPVLGYIMTVIDCLDGRKINYKFGKYDVVASGFTKAGKSSTANFTFDAKQATELEASIRKEYGDTGTIKVDKGSGSIVLEVAVKDGTTNTMIFTPSTESGTMRQMFSERGPKGQKNRIEVVYGVARVNGKENTYSFSGKTPAGDVTLSEHLKRQGFVINGDPETGRFEAVKGDEKITFVSEAKVVAKGKVTAEARTHEALASGAKFTGDELVALAETDPYMAKSLLEKVAAGNMTLTLGQLSTILGKFESAGIEASPEFVADVMAKMPKEFEALATKEHIDQVLASGPLGDLPPVAKAELRTQMKVGSTFAGAVVLLYSSPAFAATGGSSVLAISGQVMIGVGIYVGLVYYVANHTVLGKALGKLTVAPVRGLINLLSGKYSALIDARSYVKDEGPNGLEERIRTAASMVDAANVAAIGDTVIAVSKNFSDTLKALYKKATWKDKARIRAFRTRFQGHVDALIKAQSSLTKAITAENKATAFDNDATAADTRATAADTRAKQADARAKQADARAKKGDPIATAEAATARTEATAARTEATAARAEATAARAEATAARAEAVTARKGVTDPKITELSKLSENLNEAISRIDNDLRKYLSTPGVVGPTFGLAVSSLFVIWCAIMAGDASKDKLKELCLGLPLGIGDALCGPSKAEKDADLNKEVAAVEFLNPNPEITVGTVTRRLLTNLDGSFTKEFLDKHPGREVEAIKDSFLDSILMFMIFSNKTCLELLSRSANGKFTMDDLNIWYGKARTTVFASYTLPPNLYISVNFKEDLLPAKLTLPALQASIKRKKIIFYKPQGLIEPALWKIEGLHNAD